MTSVYDNLPMKTYHSRQGEFKKLCAVVTEPDHGFFANPKPVAPELLLVGGENYIQIYLLYRNMITRKTNGIVPHDRVITNPSGKWGGNRKG